MLLTSAPVPPCPPVASCASLQIYHSGNKMSRNSAPQVEKMVMAGMRVPRKADGNARFGRYSGDSGETLGGGG